MSGKTTAITLDEVMKLGGGVVQRVADIGRVKTYKTFYFPAEEYELPEGRDDTYGFDPRIFSDYVATARAYNYAQWIPVRMPEAKGFKAMSVLSSTNQMSTSVRYWLERAADEYSYFSRLDEDLLYQAAACVASILYFQKEDLINLDRYEKLLEVIAPYVEAEYEKVLDLCHNIPADEFVGITIDNVDFMTADERTEYLKAQEEYKVYNDRVWEMMSQVENVSICANITNGMFAAKDGSEIKIEQLAQCIQAVDEFKVEIDNDEEERTKEKKVVTGMVIAMVVVILVFAAVLIFFGVKISRERKSGSKEDDVFDMLDEPDLAGDGDNYVTVIL